MARRFCASADNLPMQDCLVRSVGHGWRASVLLALVACSPVLDWRKVEVADATAAPLVAMFPCRPAQHERSVVMNDGAATMSLRACDAGSWSFALAQAEVGGARAQRVLLQWREALSANLAAPGASSWQAVASPLRGATPSADAGRLEVDGRRPGGQPVHASALFFMRDGWVYQATVLGPADAEVAGTFFEGLGFRD